MGKSITMTFAQLDSDCWVCTSHLHNEDGYLRKTWGSSRKPEERVAEMFHRFIFRAHNGLEEIPEGFEIDHTCNVRACCNPAHLRLLPRLEHLVHTSKTRWIPKVWRLAA